MHFFEKLVVFEELVLRAQKELEDVATRILKLKTSTLKIIKNESGILQHNKSPRGFVICYSITE